MTQEYVLRAMAANYAGGHNWDPLDSEACVKAADEIASLRAKAKLSDSLLSGLIAVIDGLKSDLADCASVTSSPHISQDRGAAE